MRCNKCRGAKLLRALINAAGLRRGPDCLDVNTRLEEDPARLPHAPAPRPRRAAPRAAGPEPGCHSRLFIRRHVRPRSITAATWSARVFTATAASELGARMIDAFRAQRGGTCSFFSNGGSRGGAEALPSSHTDPDRVTRRQQRRQQSPRSPRTVAGQLGAFRRGTSSTRSARPTFNQIRRL